MLEFLTEHFINGWLLLWLHSALFFMVTLVFAIAFTHFRRRNRFHFPASQLRYRLNSPFSGGNNVIVTFVKDHQRR
jgi:hypothetical protein